MADNDIDWLKPHHTYVGENGNASVTVSAKQGDLNQRTQDFLNSVQYEVSPNTDLSNRDTIHVTATYDEALANQYHYQPTYVYCAFAIISISTLRKKKK